LAVNVSTVAVTKARILAFNRECARDLGGTQRIEGSVAISVPRGRSGSRHARGRLIEQGAKSTPLVEPTDREPIRETETLDPEIR
jgi:hypothetical protein